MGSNKSNCNEPRPNVVSLVRLQQFNGPRSQAIISKMVGVVGGKSTRAVLATEAEPLVVALVEHALRPRTRLIEIGRPPGVVGLTTASSVITMGFEIFGQCDHLVTARCMAKIVLEVVGESTVRTPTRHEGIPEDPNSDLDS